MLVLIVWPCSAEAPCTVRSVAASPLLFASTKVFGGREREREVAGDSFVVFVCAQGGSH